MKQINFLSTLPPKQQRSIRRWYRTSWCLFILLVVGIGAVQLKQLLAVRTVMQEHRASMQHYASTKEVLDKIDCLKVQEKKTSDHHAFLADLKAHQKKTTEYLKALKTTIATKHLVLESLTEKNNTLEIVMDCVSSAQALKLAGTLAELPHLHSLRLVSLQPGSGANKTVLATLKGTL